MCGWRLAGGSGERGAERALELGLAVRESRPALGRAGKGWAEEKENWAGERERRRRRVGLRRWTGPGKRKGVRGLSSGCWAGFVSSPFLPLVFFKTTQTN